MRNPFQRWFIIENYGSSARDAFTPQSAEGRKGRVPLHCRNGVADGR